MATNLSIDQALIERAMQVSGESTPRAVVIQALEEFVAIRQQRHLVALMGKLDWDDTFDYKAKRLRN